MITGDLETRTPVKKRRPNPAAPSRKPKADFKSAQISAAGLAAADASSQAEWLRAQHGAQANASFLEQEAFTGEFMHFPQLLMMNFSPAWSYWRLLNCIQDQIQQHLLAAYLETCQNFSQAPVLLKSATAFQAFQGNMSTCASQTFVSTALQAATSLSTLEAWSCSNLCSSRYPTGSSSVTWQDHLEAQLLPRS